MKFSVKALVILITASICIAACAAGCNMQNSPAKKPQSQQENEQVQIKLELAETVKQTVEAVDGVEDSTAVVINQDISVAGKVTGFDRLRLKNIRQEMHSKVRSIAPGYNVQVTTDKKIFSELQKVEHQLNQSPGNSLPELQSKVKKLNKDMHG